MILREEFYINCDGIRLHCKSDRPEPAPAGAAPRSPKIPLVLVIPGLTGHMEEDHIITVQKLWEILPQGFVLLEGDALIRKPIDWM